MWLKVGGLAIEIQAPWQAEAALAERYWRFLCPASRSDVTVHIESLTDTFSPHFHLETQTLGLETVAGGRQVLLKGEPQGGFDRGRKAGWLDRARHVGDIDALLRLVLSIELPFRQALLLHAAAVLLPPEPSATVFVGASGAGKSTVAERLGEALADELAVLDLSGETFRVHGTPYWNGTPAEAVLGALVCLERSQLPDRRALTGTHALAALIPHVVRYVSLPGLDEAVIALLARLARVWPVERLWCPVGEAFIPYVRETLAAAHIGSR